MCDQLNALSPALEATSAEMSNAQYFEAMADVDAVLAFYDPAEYGTKMSGIVPEAICLGKPVVISDGCDGLCRFLDRYAPGSFATGTYGPGDLAAILRLPAPLWSSLGAKARASSDVVRMMKSMRRYLTLGGMSALYPGGLTAQTAAPGSQSARFSQSHAPNGTEILDPPEWCIRSGRALQTT